MILIILLVVAHLAIAASIPVSLISIMKKKIYRDIVKVVFYSFIKRIPFFLIRDY